jgi:hypothetical protein
VPATIPAPGGRRRLGRLHVEAEEPSGWGRYRDRKIYQIDPETGAILRTVKSNRFVTGVTWVNGAVARHLGGGESELRRVDPRREGSGAADMPPGANVSARVRWRRSVLRAAGREREAEGVRRPRGAATRSGLDRRAPSRRHPLTSQDKEARRGGAETDVLGSA